MAATTSSATTGSATRTFEGPIDAGAAPVRSRSRKHVLLGAALLVVLLALGAFGWNWWTVGRFFATTDDAYLSADAVTVAPRVAGYVASVLVGDNQPVRAGQVLARIDDRDYRAALAEARAEIAEAEASSQLTAGENGEQEGTIAEARTDIENADARIAFDRSERGRAASLSAAGAGTVEAAERTDAALREDTAALRHADAALATAEARIATLRAGGAYAEASLAKAKAARDTAEINLDDTVIRAPVDGTVGDRTIRVGNYVEPGVGLLTVVPMGRALYVTANFKETQLARMRVGEPAAVSVDALDGKPFRGVVDGFSPGTGAEFALLPPENATGNFTKIVQRVPVRIRLVGSDPRLALLRAGLSAEVSVDTRGAGDR